MAMILLLDLDYFKQLGDSSGKLNFTSLKRNGRMKKNSYSTVLYTSTNYKKSLCGDNLKNFP